MAFFCYLPSKIIAWTLIWLRFKYTKLQTCCFICKLLHSNGRRPRVGCCIAHPVELRCILGLLLTTSLPTPLLALLEYLCLIEVVNWDHTTGSGRALFFSSKFVRSIFDTIFWTTSVQTFRPCVIPSPFWFSSCNDFFADVTSNGGICFFFVVFVVLGNFKKISSPGCKSAWRIWGQMKKKLVKKLICQMLAYSCGSNWKMSDIEGAIGTCFEPY